MFKRINNNASRNRGFVNKNVYDYFRVLFESYALDSILFCHYSKILHNSCCFTVLALIINLQFRY